MVGVDPADEVGGDGRGLLLSERETAGRVEVLGALLDRVEPRPEGVLSSLRSRPFPATRAPTASASFNMRRTRELQPHSTTHPPGGPATW